MTQTDITIADGPVHAAPPPLARNHRVFLFWTFVILAGFGVMVWAPGPMARRVVKNEFSNHGVEWRDIMQDYLSDAALALRSGELTAEDRAFLSSYLETADFFRMNMVNTAGVITYSTDPDEVGKTQASPALARSLATGDTIVTLNEPHGAEVEAAHVDAPQLDIAEVYLPVTDGGQLAGVMTFSIDVTEEYETFLVQLRRQAAIMAGAVLLVLSVMALWFLNGLRRKQLREADDRARLERDRAELQLRLTREVRLLGELNEWLQSSRSLDELFGMVGRFMEHFLIESSGSLYVYSNSRDVLDGAVSWSGGCHHDHIHPEDCWGLRRGRTYAYGASEVDFACAHVTETEKRPYVCMPILAHGETVGLMTLTAKPGTPPAQFDGERRMAQMSAEQISLAIANVRMRDALQHQAIRDPLTGLFNRRHMMETLRRLTETRARADYSIISLDVDHFKTFNDNHGHDAGDIVLRSVGEILMAACDGDIIACRMGGEELMLLLPGVPVSDAMERADKLCVDIAALSVSYGEKTLPRITVSIGVAHSADYGRRAQDVIRAADEALYMAKARGRNQVVLAGPIDSGPPTAEAGPLQLGAKPARRNGKFPHPPEKVAFPA